MTAQLYYPPQGRGAWPSGGAGGTLKADGTGAGRFYRAAVGAAKPVGNVGYQADRNGLECNINDYATHRAVLAIQTYLKENGYTGLNGKVLTLDGVWGPNNDEAVKKFQKAKGLVADGIYGPASAKAMWAPVAKQVAAEVDSTHAAELNRLVYGTINLESVWDCGAVGATTPQDLGLGQINGPAWPTLSANDRLNPKVSLPWIARFIDGNLKAFNYDLEDAVAAYRYGRTGARQWIEAGRPQMWKNTDAHEYIDRILNPA